MRKQNHQQLSLPSLAICNGWLRSGAAVVPSPNFNERPPDSVVSLLVIHNISLPPSQYGGDYIERFFCNQLPEGDHPYFRSIKDLQVSAHCLIKRTGELVQFVGFDQRAWHAGQSVFEGTENCNDFSIGIEMEGDDTTPYTDCQYQRLHELSLLLMRSYPSITIDRIVGHCDIAPARKTDPGDAFDWQRYRGTLRDGL